jgi:hypothetical protein
MGRQHHRHWFGDWHHSNHHHYHAHDYLFGNRGDNVLVGTENSDVVIGRNGNDELFGNQGNDWLYGGRGGDLLDGGAGNDKVFGGSGDDTLVYSVAENAANGGCGNGDFYDGGKGDDVLRLILTPEEMADAAIQADIAAFRAFLADNPGGCGSRGETFEFTSFDLTVRNFEALDIPDSGTPPQANTAPEAVADTYTVTEDVPRILDFLANDKDADGDLLSAMIVDGPQHGTLEPLPDGTFTYRPELDYHGSDVFTYRASDGVDESEPVNVVIDVTPVNDPPAMVEKADWGPVTAYQNIRIEILSYYSPGPKDEVDAGQLMVDFELEGDTPYFTAYGVAGKIPDTTTLSYTALTVPTGGATDSFEYTVYDSAGGSTTAVFEIDLM